MSVNSFKAGLKESKLKGCVCEDCETLMLPPRLICNKCGSTNLKEHCFNGKGTIKTKTVVHVPLSKFQDLSPYMVGIIELDEGPLITGMVLGDIDKIKIGDRVEAFYMNEGEETILAFKVI
jgi:uncharacterized OB-fold protein